MKEPLIHSHLTDCLDDAHPLAFEQLYCKKCGVCVHAGNNECMQTWVETNGGAWCLKCFGNEDNEVLDAEDGLP